VKAVLFLLLLGACVETSSTDCGHGMVCREGTVCHPIALDPADPSSTVIECVSPDQLALCAEQLDGIACGDNGTCYANACLPNVCGNGRKDANEDCDDGNFTLGDGCSPTCLAETCGNNVIDPIRTVGDTTVLDEQCDDGNSLSHDGCASTCKLEVLHWRRVSETPVDRTLAGMAIDYAGKRAVMFGGLTPEDPSTSSTDLSDVDELFGTALGDTWELSARGWTQIDSVPSPAPRSGMAMANDGTRTYMFGGSTSGSLGSPLNDFWALDGHQWTRLPPVDSDPNNIKIGGRIGASMAYWPGHGLILFGGKQNRFYVGDTWIYDGTSWAPYPPAANIAVEAREYATLTFDPVGNRLILAGGRNATSAELGSYALDESGWTPLNPQDAPNAFASVAAFDRQLRKVVVYGGKAKVGVVGDGSEGALWTLDGALWTKRSGGQPPTARVGATGGVEPISGHLLVFGGIFLGNCAPLTCTPAKIISGEDDVWQADLSGSSPAWSRRGFTRAPRLTQAAYAYDVDRARIVVYGGRRAAGDGSVAQASSSDVTWEIAGHSWFQMSAMGPPALDDAAMTYGAIGTMPSSAILFGGKKSGTGATDEFWFYANGQWTAGPAAGRPPPRYGAAMAYDPIARKALMFGGSNGTTANNETWVLDGTGWRNLQLSGPPARFAAAIAYDPRHHTIIMFGGHTDARDLDDVWQIDLGAANPMWTAPMLSSVLKPPARGEARFAWDAARRRMLLWGSTTDNSVWQWDGSKWEFLSAFDAPQPHGTPIFSPTPTGVILMHGGTDALQQVDGELLELVRESISSNTREAACVSGIDDDDDGKPGCEDEDCWQFCTPWCPPSTAAEPVSCPSDAPYCGDGICQTPREDCGNCATDCTSAVFAGCY
jgi:cysteine-rich repeat protein